MHPAGCCSYILNRTEMNRSHGISILLLLFTGDLGLLRDSEACNTVSYIQCVNSTYFLWCVEDATGTLLTIGDAQACPGTLVCDDMQAVGCVAPDILTTTELISASTTTVPTTTVVTTDPSIETTSETVTTISPTEVSDSTAIEESSIESDADFTCIHEGLYKAQDCSRFHVCYKFIWFIKHYFARCPKGLYWSSDEKLCVLQSLSDCPTTKRV